MSINHKRTYKYSYNIIIHCIHVRVYSNKYSYKINLSVNIILIARQYYLVDNTISVFFLNHPLSVTH